MEEPNIRRTTAPRPHLETGSLASRSSAAFIRRRRHIQQEIQDTLQKLELHSKLMELRRALREEENNAIALSSCSPRQPSSTASNSKQPQPTTTHVSADLPPASARDQPGTENETGPEHEPKQEIAPATGQVLESTAHARTAGAASAHDQQTEEVSQRTPSHLPITSIDSHKGALKTYSTQPTIKERGEEAHVRSAVQGLPHTSSPVSSSRSSCRASTSLSFSI